MPAPYDRMGYERQIFYGTAGSTAATQLENVVDINYDVGVEYGDTTDRGNSASLPINTSKPVALTPKVTWTMRDKPNDTHLGVLRGYAKAGTAVAIVIKEYNAAGSAVSVLDGDFNLQVSEKHPLKGEGTFDFEATATYDAGRKPNLAP
jgi:hypothetical protein